MKIFGFADFTYNKSSGRPEEPVQWQADTFSNWLSLFIALIIWAGAGFSLFRHNNLYDAACLFAGGLLVLGIALVRFRMLRRKQEEFGEAVASYHRMIIEMTQDR